MKSKDYAHKKPKTKKELSKGNSSSPTKFKIALLLIVSVIIAFGYFLLELKKQTPRSATPITEQLKRKDISRTIPEPPKEKWSYFNELKNKEVTVKVPKSSKPSRQWRMQCGSFRTERDAESMVAQIAFQGLGSSIQRTEGNNGVWYRVVLGPYSKKRKAEHDRHTLQANNIYSCKIWHW